MVKNTRGSKDYWGENITLSEHDKHFGISKEARLELNNKKGWVTNTDVPMAGHKIVNKRQGIKKAKGKGKSKPKSWGKKKGYHTKDQVPEGAGVPETTEASTDIAADGSGVGEANE